MDNFSDFESGSFSDSGGDLDMDDSNSLSVVETPETDDMPLETLESNFGLETLEGDAGLEVLEDDTELEIPEDDTELEILEDDAGLEILEDDTELDILEGNAGSEILEDDAELEILENDAELEIIEDDMELDALEDDADLEILKEDIEQESIEVDDNKIEEMSETESSDEAEHLLTPEFADELKQEMTPEQLERFDQMVQTGQIAIEVPNAEDTQAHGPVKTLTPIDVSKDNLWESGLHDVEQILDNFRENLRDHGVEDEATIEKFIADERIKMQEDLQRSLDGELDRPYDPPIPGDWEKIAAQMKGETREPVDIEDISNWIGDINPNFDRFDIESPYSTNCGSCALAVQQRLDGNTDVVASPYNVGTVADMNQLTGMEQVEMSPEEMKEYLLSQGPGAHAIVGIDRSNGNGHWFNALCVDDKTVVALDGQSGKVSDWPPDYGDVTKWDISIEGGIHDE